MASLGLSNSWRAVATGAAACVVAAGFVVANAGTAAAAPHYAAVPSTQVGYTDSADRHTPFSASSAQEIPLGARKDDAGQLHVSRVYATFDVAQFVGKSVISSTLSFTESSAADCAKRSIEVWSTDTVEQPPSWATAPAAETRVAELAAGRFCPAQLTVDVKAAVRTAIAKHVPRVTFEIRVPDAVEKDVTFGRTLSAYRSVGLSVAYNSAPVIDPAHRYNGGKPCVSAAPYPTLNGNLLQTRALDDDGDREYNLQYTFAVWPADDPSARVELPGESGSSFNFFTRATVPDSLWVDGKTYLWQAKVTDGATESPWSQPCGYVVDRSAPSAPTVTSANFPPSDSGQTGPAGEPGVFTFNANGDLDAAGFEYSWGEFGVPGCTYQQYGRLECKSPFDSPNTVRADAAGGSATVTLTPPTEGWSTTLRVRSVDAAGNRSTPSAYTFRVPEARPSITVVGGAPQWGDEVTLRFAAHPAVSGTVGFEYRHNYDAPVVVAAGPDGTASITVRVDKPFGDTVSVRSRSANGWVSSESSWSPYFDFSTRVWSDDYPMYRPSGGPGVAGVFTVTPPPALTRPKGYYYRFGWDEQQFVEANADGTATFTVTPAQSGEFELVVTAVRADGTPVPYSAYYPVIVAE